MTATDTANKFRYEGNGVTDTFAFPGRVFASSDIIVEIVTRTTDALEETLTESTHYIVTIAANGTASVQVTSAPKIPSSSQDILLRRNVPQTQTLSLPTGTKFPAKSVETSLDRITILVQDLEEQVLRSIKLPAQTSAAEGVTSNPQDNTLLAWDGIDGALKNVTLSSVSTGLDAIFTGLSSGDFITYNGANWVNIPGSGVATTAGNNTFTGTTTLTGVVTVNGTASAPAAVRLAEDTDNGTNYIGLAAPASVAANVTFTVPGADGTAGQYLKTDGAGTLAFASNPFIAGLKDKVLNGLVLSNNGTDATNDIDIASGACVSDDGTTVMTLSAITKRLDAAWAVGTNQGGLDTGSIADTTYHLWVINRPDTDVTDVLFSASASAPTLPANYTKKKCIGSIIRAGGTILGFEQFSNEFFLDTPQAVYDSGASAGTSTITATIPGIPLGVKVKMMGVMTIVDNANYVRVSSLDNAAVSPSTSASPLSSGGVGTGATLTCYVEAWTNTSGQVRVMQSSNSAGGFKIVANGWVDQRV